MGVGRKTAGMVLYANPQSVPANLQRVAAINASGYLGSGNHAVLGRWSGSWRSLANIPAGQQLLGAVLYTLGSTIPANMRRVIFE